MKKLVKKLLATLTLVLSAGTASAANFSVVSALQEENDLVLFNFSLLQAANVTLQTLSYDGGNPAQFPAINIPAGGFDPLLSLFDAAGNLVGFGDDINFIDGDPVGSNLDARIVAANLGAGSYRLILSNFANEPIGDTLAEGFTGLGSFDFTDSFGQVRTPLFAVDLINISALQSVVFNPADVTVVPIPAAVWLMGTALVALGVGLRRRAGEA